MSKKVKVEAEAGVKIGSAPLVILNLGHSLDSAITLT